MRLALIWMGKTKARFASLGTEEYLTRLRGFGRGTPVTAVVGEEITARDPQDALLRRAQGCRLWLLDPAGQAFTSPEFAGFLERQAMAFPQDMVLAVGAADGFAVEVQAAAAGRISLSPLTLSHELARLVALEQIYRALAIMSHHPYPH